jgi:hypothetical protein
MKKDWINQRRKVAEEFLEQLGIGSLLQLSTCSLLIHVSFGKEDDGKAIIVKPSQINVNEKTIEFILKPPVEVDLDASEDGLGEDLEHMVGTESFLITDLTYRNEKWVATTDEDGAAGQMNGNIDVELIFSFTP